MEGFRVAQFQPCSIAPRRHRLQLPLLKLALLAPAPATMHYKVTEIAPADVLRATTPCGLLEGPCAPAAVLLQRLLLIVNTLPLRAKTASSRTPNLGGMPGPL